MDQGSSKRKAPRIRKTAPTVRERAEAAQIKASRDKPKRLSAVTKRLPRPTRRLKLHLPDNQVTAALRRIGRVLRKIFGWLAPKYFANSWREVRKVTWPNRRETWRLTLAVLIFSVVFGALVSGVDKGLDELFKHFVLK